MRNYVRTNRKNYYELSSATLTCDQLAAIVPDQSKIMRKWINMNSCSVVRVRY